MSNQSIAKGYKKLFAWQKADELATEVFAALSGSTTIPRWLRDQVCRAAISVPANIAEGYSRRTLGDYLRFLDIARGSLAETEYFIEFLAKQKLLAPSTTDRMSSLLEETGRMLFGLIKTLTDKRGSATRGREPQIGEADTEYQADSGKLPLGFQVIVSGRPPVHESASGYSLHNEKHPSCTRARTLSERARLAVAEGTLYATPVVLEIENGARRQPGDASNVIQAVSTALEGVVFLNDGLVKEVHYREVEGEQDGYVVRVRPRLGI